MILFLCLDATQSELIMARPARPCNACCQSQQPKFAQQTHIKLLPHYHVQLIFSINFCDHLATDNTI